MTTSAPAVPTSHGGAHPRDLLAGHVLCFAAMAVMVVATIPGWLATASVAAFGVGVAWCGWQAARAATRGAYLRLGVCCAAMVVMLVPHVPAAGLLWPGAPEASGDHAGHSLAGHVAGTSALSGAAVPVLVTSAALAALALVVLASTRQAVARGVSRPGRLAAALEAVLAGGMGAMLLALH